MKIINSLELLPVGEDVVYCGLSVRTCQEELAEVGHIEEGGVVPGG